MFYPLQSISRRMEPGTTIHHLTVALLLPSGVSSDNFSVRISEDRNTMTIGVTWADILVNLKHLHREWLFCKGSNQIKIYHPN